MKGSRLHRHTELRAVKPLERRTPLKAVAALERTAPPKRSKRISPATGEQKAKVAGLACIAELAGPCLGDTDPAHLIDRSLAPAAGDDIRAVVPLCRRHHNEYDDGDLDLAPYLEPRWRVEAAWAVEAVGLVQAVRRISGKRFVPIDEATA